MKYEISKYNSELKNIKECRRIKNTKGNISDGDGIDQKYNVADNVYVYVT